MQTGPISYESLLSLAQSGYLVGLAPVRDPGSDATALIWVGLRPHPALRQIPGGSAGQARIGVGVITGLRARARELGLTPA